ncbi:MAG: hypothetical protein NTV34_19435 [Proteobacteria bacterium]|nr:hypothetical protein [Pseudomonadota bacterium]
MNLFSNFVTVFGLVFATSAAFASEILNDTVVKVCVDDISAPSNDSGCDVQCLHDEAKFCNATCTLSYTVLNVHSIVTLLDDGTTKASQYTVENPKVESIGDGLSSARTHGEVTWRAFSNLSRRLAVIQQSACSN